MGIQGQSHAHGHESIDQHSSIFNVYNSPPIKLRSSFINGDIKGGSKQGIILNPMHGASPGQQSSEKVNKSSELNSLNPSIPSTFQM